jgi:hypothetical protein
MRVKDNIMEITQRKLPRSFPFVFFALSLFFDESFFGAGEPEKVLRTTKGA